MSGDWNYFNGDMHGFDDAKGYHPPKPMTRAYCWGCGPTHIAGFGVEAAAKEREAAQWERETGRRDDEENPFRRIPGHWGTGFRCAPWRIGRPCDGCGKDI